MLPSFKNQRFDAESLQVPIALFYVFEFDNRRHGADPSSSHAFAATQRGRSVVRL